MKQIVLIKQSADQSITNDVMLQCAAAFAIQNQRDVAPVWNGQKTPSGATIDAEATFSVAENDAGIPVDAVPAYVQDDIDAPGAEGYHDDDGKPEIRIGVVAIMQGGGGTLITGAVSLSVCESHENCELLGDIDANEWVPMPDGVHQVAFELSDPVEGDAYPIDVPAIGAQPATQVWVSNFVFPAYFVPGAAGPYDFMGKIKAPLTMAPGGYQILKDKSGNVADVFAMSPAEGGMPLWRRAEKAKNAKTPGTRHHRRHHGHKRTMAAAAPATVLISGETTPRQIAQQFAPGRVIVRYDGDLLVLCERDAQGVWNLSGDTPTPEEAAFIQANMPDVDTTGVTVTKDPS